MRLKVECVHFLIRHLNTFIIRLANEMGLHRQARLGLGITDVVQDIFKRTQGTASPSLADLTEQTVLDGVPFGRARWVVTNSDRQATSISDLFLKISLPHPRARAIAATAVRFNHQMRGVGEALRQLSLAPSANVINSESRCIGRLTDIDCAVIVLPLVDAIGHRTSKRIIGEVVEADTFWRLAPNLTRVLEIAHKLLFLGIYANHGLSLRLMLGALLLNVLKLPIPIRMLLACQLLYIGFQRVIVLPQQAANHWQADSMTLLIETFLNIYQAAVEPLAVTHRITRCVHRDDVQQSRL